MKLRISKHTCPDGGYYYTVDRHVFWFLWVRLTLNTRYNSWPYVFEREKTTSSLDFAKERLAGYANGEYDEPKKAKSLFRACKRETIEQASER